MPYMSICRFISTAKPIVLILAIVILICSATSALTQEILQDGVEARVNGTKISSTAVDIIEAQIKKASEGSVSRIEIVNQLIDLAILSQAAESNSIHEDPAIIEALKLQYEQTLASAYIAVLSQNVEVSDTEIREEYDNQVDNIEPTEFNARHILVDTRAEAVQIISKLENGNDFAELAKEYSTDSSAAIGGQLGWINIETYMPEFKAAVEVMEVGARSREPFETKFGWHVLNLIDTRGPPPPDYLDVQSELKGVIVNRKVNDLVKEMRTKSDIVLKQSVVTELE